MPSVISDIENSAIAMESPQNQSPISCGSISSDLDRLELAEDLGVADTVLADDNWGWLRDLLDPVEDAAVRQQSKLFFARLYKTQDAGEAEATLAEMETWRTELDGESERPQEHELVRALFLLGYDKSMSLAR